MRTIVYIDGYNLYYGRLTGTDYKWLDVVSLMERLAKTQRAASDVIKVCYFTAPVKARYSRRGEASVTAQNVYHEALKTMHSGRFEIISGYHQDQRDHMMRYVAGEKPSKDDTVEVWRLNEKQTDVNIAIRMYRDAVQGVCDQMILCSNDTDAVPVLEAIKSDCPEIVTGVVAPIRPGASRIGATPAMSDLQKRATWAIGSINDADLLSAQLPGNIPRERRKPLRCPDHWRPASLIGPIK